VNVIRVDQRAIFCPTWDENQQRARNLIGSTFSSRFEVETKQVVEDLCFYSVELVRMDRKRLNWNTYW
jgi:hypothetical protein